MDTDAVLHPRGPLPPRVYWQRRAGTAGAVILVVFLLFRVGSSGSDDTLGANASPTPAPRPTPTSPSAVPSGPVAASPALPARSPSATRAEGQPCRDADLTVRVTADGKDFGPGQRPRLTLVVTNIAPVACTRDLGGAAREIRVVSGVDRVWSSDDCSPGGRADVVLLRPAASRSFPVTWSRTRSKPNCPTDRPAAAPGTYRAIGRIGTLERPGDTFTLR